MEFINQAGTNYLCMPGCSRRDPVRHWLTGLEYNKMYGKRYHYNYNGYRNVVLNDACISPNKVQKVQLFTSNLHLNLIV